MTAIWNNDVSSYQLSNVRLTANPMLKKDRTPDLRYAAVNLEIPFAEFGERVRRALSYIDQLNDLRSFNNAQTNRVEVLLNESLFATLDGIFFVDWPYAPVLGRNEHAKVAVEAILELLELEAGLPSEKI